MTEADARRRAATRAFWRYFVLAFFVVGALSGLTAYTLFDARDQHQQTMAVRLEYCHGLEALKTQAREDVARDKRNYKRNLRLLGIKDTPALRKAASDSWALKLRRAAPKTCPYTGDTSDRKDTANVHD